MVQSSQFFGVFFRLCCSEVWLFPRCVSSAELSFFCGRPGLLRQKSEQKMVLSLNVVCASCAATDVPWLVADVVSAPCGLLLSQSLDLTVHASLRLVRGKLVWTSICCFASWRGKLVQLWHTDTKNPYLHLALLATQTGLTADGGLIGICLYLAFLQPGFRRIAFFFF